MTFELERKGGEVLLTVTHRRLSGRDGMLGVSAGWHAHLDILVDRMAGREPGPFWSTWSRLRAEYAERMHGRMIPKSGYRFSEKIMRKAEGEER